MIIIKVLFVQPLMLAIALRNPDHERNVLFRRCQDKLNQSALLEDVLIFTAILLLLPPQHDVFDHGPVRGGVFEHDDSFWSYVDAEVCTTDPSGAISIGECEVTPPGVASEAEAQEGVLDLCREAQSYISWSGAAEGKLTIGRTMVIHLSAVSKPKVNSISANGMFRGVSGNLCNGFASRHGRWMQDAEDVGEVIVVQARVLMSVTAGINDELGSWEVIIISRLRRHEARGRKARIMRELHVVTWLSWFFLHFERPKSIQLFVGELEGRVAACRLPLGIVAVHSSTSKRDRRRRANNTGLLIHKIDQSLPREIEDCQLELAHYSTERGDSSEGWRDLCST